MKRFLRRAAMLTAATTACAALLPVAGAQAAPLNWSPCDNEVQASPNTVVVLPGGLGYIEIQLGTSEDVFVRYDGPGTPLDVIAGADLQTISLDQNTAVCFALPGWVGVEVTVNVVNLLVEACTYSGEPYTLGPCVGT
jgi:hypothetical protein